MAYTTGSEGRDLWLKRAIAEVIALHEQPTFGTVTAHLPNDFDLDAEELAGMLADLYPDHVLPETAPPKPEQVESVALEPPEDEITYEVDPALLTTAEGIERVKRGIAESEARRQLDEANARLDAARERMVNAQVRLRHTRADLAAAITQWQLLAESVTDGLSAEQRRQIETRNFLASTAKDRAANPRLGRNANAFVFSRMRNGPNRGAFSRSAAARSGYINRDPSRGPVAKIPSER